MNERLVVLRKKLKYTQTEFAKRIQISRSHLSGLENNTRNFTERLIADICREFNVNKDWFLTGEGDMFNDILNEIPLFHEASKEVQEAVRLYMQLDPIVQAYYKKKMEEEVRILKK